MFMATPQKTIFQLWIFKHLYYNHRLYVVVISSSFVTTELQNTTLGIFSLTTPKHGFEIILKSKKRISK